MRSADTYKTIAVILAILVLAGLFVFYVVSMSNKEKSDSPARHSLVANDEESFTDQSGKVVDLSQFNDRIRVVNSWATWVPLSKDELINLNDLAGKYDQEKVVFLAINRKEHQDYAGTYLNSIGSLNNLVVVFDSADNFFSRIEGYAMPETVVFDRFGEVAAHYRGAVKPNELQATIDDLLSE